MNIDEPGTGTISTGDSSCNDRQQWSASINKAKLRELRFRWVGQLVLIIVIIILFALILNFVVDGSSRLGWDFFTHFPSRKPERAGILSAWVGSSLIMLVTACTAIPIGVGAGIYLEEYAPRTLFTSLIEINVANLAAVPSIIYGLLALGLFVQVMGLGETILVGGLTLGLLVLPVIIVSTREALRAVPWALREAGYGLGADRWQVISGIVLPIARPSILTGAIVALSRAIGETAPLITIGALTFIAFLPPPLIDTSFPYVQFDWLSAPFSSMPIQMFNWISRPQQAFHENAAAAGVVLIGMVVLMNGLAIWLRFRLRRQLNLYKH